MAVLRSPGGEQLDVDAPPGLQLDVDELLKATDKLEHSKL
jgi:hypothetical protein